MAEEKNIKLVSVDDHLKEAYLDYSMSVIVGRALPDIRDGLKPVHRRILYAMHEMGLQHNKRFTKCAGIVGDVLKKYHPHGDAAVYDALVRLAQDWSLRYPLIIGQGNFGSIDNDPPAAYRYTEAKLSKLAEDILIDIDKETVDFVPNFDGSLNEPAVLPSRIPNLLINGSSGIAVGMATNIPPHNITECCSAIAAFVDNPSLDYVTLMKHIKGPDFPTGGIICGTSGIRSAYRTGRGKIILRGKAEIIKNKIVIGEIPYQVSKSGLIESIAEAVKEKKIEGITDIRDESDKEGMRIVVETRQNTQPEVILNQLYQYTPLQTTFGIILLALVDGQPRILSLIDTVKLFVDFRISVITRRIQFDLRKAEEKIHLLEGLIIALNNIDAVIKLIKASSDVQNARAGLREDFNLSELQVQAILEMKLQRLTSLEQDKVKDEHKSLVEFAKECRVILDSRERILNIIKNDLLEIKNNYSDHRRTEIQESDEQLETEDIIEREDVVITITHSGYVKRLPVDTYKAQRRGGKGIQATAIKEEDFVEDIITTNTHTNLLFFTNKGRVHWLKAYMIPEGSRYAKGTAVVNLLSLENGETVRSVIAVEEFVDGKYLLFGTKNGAVKKTELKEYANQRKGGIIAINLRTGDDLVDVRMTDGMQEVIIATRDGRAVRFSEADVSVVGRNSVGVRGINTRGSEVIGMESASGGSYLLTVTEKGYGKLTEVSDYRLISRGGSGVINIKIGDKNGKVVAVKSVNKDEDVIFITKNGMLIRTAVNNISVIGRNTQGFRLMKLDEGDSVVSVAKVKKEEG